MSSLPCHLWWSTLVRLPCDVTTSLSVHWSLCRSRLTTIYWGRTRLSWHSLAFRQRSLASSRSRVPWVVNSSVKDLPDSSLLPHNTSPVVGRRNMGIAQSRHLGFYHAAFVWDEERENQTNVVEMVKTGFSRCPWRVWQNLTLVSG